MLGNAPLLHGRCPECKVTYRWELDRDEPLLLRDAVCGDCEVPLHRTCGRPTRSAAVQDVDADWLRRSDATAT